MFEREREPGSDRVHPLVEVPALDARDPLEPEAPRPQVDALREPGLLTRLAGERDRLRVFAGAPQVARRDQSLGGGLAGKRVGGEGVGGDDARGERACAVALELVDRRQAALGIGERAAGARRAPCRHDLALRAGCLSQLAGQLRDVRVTLE